MRKVMRTIGVLLFLIGVSGAIDHLWYQPFLGVVLNSFNRFVVPHAAVLDGYELAANLGVAAVGAALVIGMEALRGLRPCGHGRCVSTRMPGVGTVGPMSTLVTGATGMVGRRVLTELRSRGLPVTGASRTAQTRLDWTDTTHWGEVLEGVKSVFVVTPVGSALGHRVAGFLEKAARSGVGNAVVMSAMGTEHAPSDSDQRAAELRAKELFDRWTVLRPNWLFQDFTEGAFASLARSRNGRLELPVRRSTAISFVDARDVADTAVAALLGDRDGREYTLTGPQALTCREVVRQTKGTESPVWRFKSTDEAGFYFRATNKGWSERYVETLNERFAAAVVGRAAETTEGVREALGRDPIPLARFVREAVL